MNIFKILANGDGTINEANISAFLGYLLDPYADHGLGFEFLESFLNQLEIENFNPINYEYEIFFEQAFKEIDKSKQIVDIVLICYENNKGLQKENIVKSIINSKREIKYIFLIENKIKESSKTKDQLKNQFQSTVKELEIDKELIHSIYITPNNESLNHEFKSFESETKKHLFWKDENTNPSIYSLLKDLIEKEAKGEIEAINEYTKHTIKSFIIFIKNDFKSEKQEEKERKFERDILYNIDEFETKYGHLLNPHSIDLVKKFTNHINTNHINTNGISNLLIRHSKTHCCTVLFNDKKIFSLTRKGKELEIRLLIRNFIVSESILKDYKFRIEELKLISTLQDKYGFIIYEKDIPLEKIINLFNLHIQLLNQQ